MFLKCIEKSILPNLSASNILDNSLQKKGFYLAVLPIPFCCFLLVEMK